jgi:hypothetical protein
VLVSPTQPLQSGGTPSPLLARCNWWGNASGSGGPNGVPGGLGARVQGPVNVTDFLLKDTCLDEMVFPVFGLVRGSLSNAMLRPARNGFDYDFTNHKAVDIVPIGAFQTQCSTEIDDDWDTWIPSTPGSLKDVYAIADGTLIGLSDGSYCCDAVLRPASTSSYKDLEFVYVHIALDPALGNQVSRQVKAGERIEYIINQALDIRAGGTTHLHFGARLQSNPSLSQEPYRFLITGMMRTDLEIRCRSLCPTTGCCPP